MKLWNYLGMMIGLSLLLNSLTPTTGHAVGMKVVFVNTLWGGALGGIVGAAVWALTDDRNEKDKDKNATLEAFVIRGTSFGILGGMGYGFYESEEQRQGFSGRPEQSHSFFHYSVREQTLSVNPLALSLQLVQESTSSTVLPASWLNVTF